MERLTNPLIVPKTGEVLAYKLNPGVTDVTVKNKLGKYEDLAEQGKLLRLQFKVGDFVWDDEFKTRCKITGYSFGRAEGYIDDPVSETEVVYYYTNLGGSIAGSFAECEIGKTMFHSKEEAEAALKKMKGE